jgi:PAS domain S-box-containing protein
MSLVTFIIGLSVLLQFLSAALALRLIRITGKKTAWSLIALAITLMTFRRVESLVMAISDDASFRPDYLFELLGLAISALMFFGISRIKPLFLSITRVREEQQLLLDHTRDFIFRHDPVGVITYVSPAVERITGYPPEEWLVHYTRHYTDNPVNEYGRHITDEMLESGAPGPHYIVEVKHKDGGTVWLEVSKQPYFVNGRVAGIIGAARDITKRIGLEKEREKLISELREALAGIRTLKGLLPICSSCKKVRDDKGYWNQIEAYVSEHSEAEFTHGICPECAQKLYPGYYEKT